MSDRIAHRGPDGARMAIRDDRVGLAHRRLAIIDLTDAAAQPMRSTNGHEVVYNGEIYNYLELRDELTAMGRTFRTASDTEVLLQAYDEWGPDCLSRLNGMFAFALYDPGRRRLFAARDRFGEKPFYYHHAAGGPFVFASEAKALLVHPAVPCRPDPRTIYRFLRYKETDRDPDTFFEGVNALPAGHWLTLDVDSGRLEVRRYWSLADGPLDQRDRAQLVERYRDLLGDAIRIRLRSDVPVGSSLSGGLDSSAVVGYIARACGIEYQHTFSARFPGWSLDEGSFIADVVAFTGANGHEVSAIPDLHELQRVAWHQEEPFLSLSVCAQWSVMQLAQQSGVTVLLDGQGADETVAGYHTYLGPYYRSLFRSGRWSTLSRHARGYASRHGSRRLAGLGYYVLPTEWTRRAKQLVHEETISRDFAAAHGGLQEPLPVAFDDDVRQALFTSVTTSVLPTLLRYADRNSMAFGREVRLPYLDHRLVEFAFTLPTELKIAGAEMKVVLRDAMAAYLPPSVRDRRDKIGYAPPQRQWLLGPLRDSIDDLIADGRTAQRPWIDAGRLRAAWKAFVAGDVRDEGRVVRAISLELWSRQFLDVAHTVSDA